MNPKKIGLLFTPKNRALVRAGLKTQTRRGNGLKGFELAEKAEWHKSTKLWWFLHTDRGISGSRKCPYGNPQVDPVQYYLKEPVQIVHPGDNGKMLVEWLDDGTSAWVDVTADDIIKIDDRKRGWESPTTAMFMLQSFARTWLTGVRTWPERLGDLSAADAIAEGIELDPSVVVTPGDFDEMKSWEFSYVWRDYLNGGYDLNSVQSYASLWESINGKGSWNPKKWVWGVEWQAPGVAA